LAIWPMVDYMYQNTIFQTKHGYYMLANGIDKIVLVVATHMGLALCGRQIVIVWCG
jgi:hypothetical protein